MSHIINQKEALVIVCDTPDCDTVFKSKTRDRAIWRLRRITRTYGWTVGPNSTDYCPTHSQHHHGGGQ